MVECWSIKLDQTTQGLAQTKSLSTCTVGFQGDKHLMSKELAIPYRDLRLLDPEVQLT